MAGDFPIDSRNIKRRGARKIRDGSLKNCAEQLPVTEQGGFAVIPPEPSDETPAKKDRQEPVD